MASACEGKPSLMGRARLLLHSLPAQASEPQGERHATPGSGLKSEGLEIQGLPPLLYVRQVVLILTKMRSVASFSILSRGNAFEQNSIC